MVFLHNDKLVTGQGPFSHLFENMVVWKVIESALPSSQPYEDQLQRWVQ